MENSTAYLLLQKSFVTSDVRLLFKPRGVTIDFEHVRVADRLQNLETLDLFPGVGMTS